MADEIVLSHAPTERSPNEGNPIEVGQWYWVSCESRQQHTDEGEPTDRWLGCVVHVGTNFVKMAEALHNSEHRIHLNEFDDRCTIAPDYDSYIERQITHHRNEAAELMNEIARVTASLGVGVRPSLAEPTTESMALAVAHGTGDIQAHKAALILAKQETLPQLFKKVERAHEMMASWMKTRLVPMQAHLKGMQRATSSLNDRIFTVELYAGFTEDLVQIAEGAPAPNDTKVTLFQRRHYMDEECLVDYAAGGMEFKDITAFDQWIATPANRDRILPFPRCVVAFQIRRNTKERQATSISDWIKFWYEGKADKYTALYLRNGDQLFRMWTAIEFGEKLFPDRERVAMFTGEELWINHDGYHHENNVVNRRAYDDAQMQYKQRRSEHAAKLWKWKREGKKGMEPWFHRRAPNFEKLDAASVYYDDAIESIRQAANEHNRVAVVLQGLLDRSPAFHPHPPWRLWTPEGFERGVDLLYDSDRALVDGPAPDFEVYRARLNLTIKRGSMMVGQEDAWMAAEAEKENSRGRRDYPLRRTRPYGNPGPGLIAPVAKLARKGDCTFEWRRRRLGYARWKSNEIPCRFTCSQKRLLNVSAYTAGDFKIFYRDPRTRADYLQWAPLLLAAEDYVNGKGAFYAKEDKYTEEANEEEANEEANKEANEEANEEADEDGNEEGLAADSTSGIEVVKSNLRGEEADVDLSGEEADVDDDSD